MAKESLPTQLNICLTSLNFQILGRSTDHGFVWPLAKGLANQGHQVTVISSKSPLGKPEITRDGVRVFYLHEGFPNKSHLRFDDAVYEKFLELHQQYPFHLVHSMDASAFKIGRRKKYHNVSVSYDVEATRMSELFAILGMEQETALGMLQTGIAVVYEFLKSYLTRDRNILNTADGVFVSSPRQRIFLERYYAYPDYHTYSVPYGVELADFSPKEKSLEIRQKLGISADAHVVVTTSDMTDPREVIHLLKAFEIVAIKKNQIFLLILGDGPHFKQVEYQMLNLALGSRVFMTGAMTAIEMSDYISAGDIFINLSSKTTGYDASILEAMAQKKVVIGSELSPLADVIEDGVDGFLLRPADSESLSQLLLELFSGGMPLTEIGDRARQKIINIFDTKKMVFALLDAYRKILVNSGRFKS